MRHKILRGLVGTLMAVAAVLGSSAQPAFGTETEQPVIFVHGFHRATCPGIDVSTAHIGALGVEMAERAHTGPLVPVAYYACDTGGPSIQQSGDPAAYFSSGKLNGGNTDNTDIRHIAYQLSWWIYDNYTAQGETVNIVGYSMGGLITRWALYQIAADNPLFPPELLVQDAVTVSTPHRGIPSAALICGNNLQCRQLTASSTFINELHTYGRAPQATGGTDWSVLGSTHCDIMNETSATDMGPVHKYVWTAGSPKCYSHTAYMSDGSNDLDWPRKESHGGGAFTTPANGPRSLATVVEALSRADR